MINIDWKIGLYASGKNIGKQYGLNGYINGTKIFHISTECKPICFLESFEESISEGTEDECKQLAFDMLNSINQFDVLCSENIEDELTEGNIYRCLYTQKTTEYTDNIPHIETHYRILNDKNEYETYFEDMFIK